MAKSRFILALAATSALLLALCGTALADTTVEAKLRPQNGSGAGGSVTLTGTDDGRLRVVVHATGLVPGQPHAQHIHGSIGGKHFTCPSKADDTDGDGYLSNEEAAGEYGTIFLSLTTKGDASPASGLDLTRMPIADSSGRIEYKRTFSAKQVPDGLLDQLSEVHVVQHGIDVNDNDRYDLAGLGESTFAKNLGAPGVPEEATNPATCGVVTGAGAPKAPHGGVETGGTAERTVSVPLAVVGGLLLALSGVVLFLRKKHVRVERVT